MTTINTAQLRHECRTTAESSAGELAGKYMTFKVGNEEYGFQILKVREIIKLLEITAVPRSAECIRGVVNLRGKVIPVLDLRVTFGMERSVATDQSVIIVVQVSALGRDLTVGILVDQVLEVLSLDASQIEPPPSFAERAADVAFVLGVAKIQERVVFLLDIDAVLSPGDTEAVSAVAA